MNIRKLLIGTCCLSAAPYAVALSLGQALDEVQLGAPVNLRFEVQPDADAATNDSCVEAQVWFGDQLVAAEPVQALPDNRTVRVRTRSSVNEPLVTVQLRAGCSGSVARSYTFLANPPTTLSTSTQPIDLNALAVRTPVAPAVATSPAPSPPPPKPRPPKKAVAPQPAVKAAEPPPAPQTSTSVNASAATTTARLRMEPLELEPAAEATDATDAAIASSAQEPPLSAQTQALLDENTQRMAQLEQQLQALQTQLQASRDETQALSLIHI